MDSLIYGKLVPIEGNVDGFTVPGGPKLSMTQSIFFIGRAREAEIQIRGSFRSISACDRYPPYPTSCAIYLLVCGPSGRFHAVLRYMSGKAYLQNISERGGIWVCIAQILDLYLYLLHLLSL